MSDAELRNLTAMLAHRGVMIVISYHTPRREWRIRRPDGYVLARAPTARGIRAKARALLRRSLHVPH